MTDLLMCTPDAPPFLPKPGGREIEDFYTNPSISEFAIRSDDLCHYIHIP
jgi:hypothetical protein